MFCFFQYLHKSSYGNLNGGGEENLQLDSRVLTVASRDTNATLQLCFCGLVANKIFRCFIRVKCHATVLIPTLVSAFVGFACFVPSSIGFLETLSKVEKQWPYHKIKSQETLQCSHHIV